jgi:hypothetical protein
VIVTGCSASTNVWPYTYDYATIKYSSSGVPLWTNCYNRLGDSDDCASAIAVDGSNNVIVTGYSSGSVGYYDYATIKYSGAGVALWTNRYDGTWHNDDYASAVAVDGSNNIVVTGRSLGTTYNDDYATVKYSSAGAPLWTNRYNGSADDYDQATAVAVDRSNNVVVVGHSYSSASHYDYVTIKYSSVGGALWTNRYSGPQNGNDDANAVAVDHSGNVIVTGLSNTGGANYDIATVKYVSVVPPPLLTAWQLTNGPFQLRVDNVLWACTLVIEASTNLSGWASVFTNTTPTNAVFYTDPDAGSASARFYRAFQFP